MILAYFSHQIEVHDKSYLLDLIAFAKFTNWEKKCHFRKHSLDFPLQITSGFAFFSAQKDKKW